MTIKNKISDHFKNKKFSRITRRVSDDWDEISRGYIVDYSDEFVVLQESNDFKLLGFNILPIHSFTKVRYKDHDKYYDKIMTWENEKNKMGLRSKVDLTNWKTIFKTFQKKKMNVIVECEDPKLGSFTIGPVKRVTDKSAYIRYIDANGIYDEKPTRIDFNDISKIMFDDRYIDVFSKYTRERRNKKTTANKT